MLSENLTHSVSWPGYKELPTAPFCPNVTLKHEGGRGLHDSSDNENVGIVK